MKNEYEDACFESERFTFCKRTVVLLESDERVDESPCIAFLTEVPGELGLSVWEKEEGRASIGRVL